MKATKIYYKELRTFGQYNNREIGIELEVQEGEKAADVLKKAKLFAQLALSGADVSTSMVESVVRAIHSAQNTLQDFSSKLNAELALDDEIPF
jgi:hypothetical protein